MAHFNNFNKIPFLLELRVDKNLKNDDYLKYQDTVENIENKLKLRLITNYPYFNISSSKEFIKNTQNNNYNPSIKVSLKPKYFYLTFGNNIDSGISLILGQYNLPLEVNRKWYQTGNLYIPSNLEEYVQNIYLERNLISNKELNLFKPKI